MTVDGRLEHDRQNGFALAAAAAKAAICQVRPVTADHPCVVREHGRGR